MTVAKDSEHGERDEPRRRRRTKRSALRETLVLLTVGVVSALLLRAFVLQTFWIPSESMENTLLVNDRVAVNVLPGAPERGDIVVFKGWDGIDTIKRVIGVGGDTVKCCDAQRRITVNGVPLDEEGYLYPGDYASGGSFEVKVPAGRLWLMGDHRTDSRDSRDFHEHEGDGTVPESDVRGRAFAIYWPLSRATILSRPDTFAKVP
jgi:signal peptidase I